MKVNSSSLSRYLIIFVFVFLGCRKEKAPFENTIDPHEKISTSFPEGNFENVIFKNDLTNLGSLTNLPDELQVSGGESIHSNGIILSNSSPFRMKYPSTLDRSQVIIDVIFRPPVQYKNLATSEELTLKEVKGSSQQFVASMEDVTTFVGKSLMSIAGTVFGFKVTSKGVHIELYKLTNGTSSSNEDVSERTPSHIIPLNVFFGDVERNYWEEFNLRFTLTKDVNLNHLKIENLQTGVIITCEGKSKSQSNGCQWGYGFIRCETQSVVTVQKFIYRSLETLSPRVLFLGHSFIEGNSLASTPEGFDARYAAIIRDSLKGSAVLAGMGGANTNNVLSRLKMDLEPFSPKYVIVDCIANENFASVWHTNMLAIIQKIKDKKAIPILVTASPRLGYENVITTANNLIRGSLGYKYVDLNDVVSDNKSASIWKPFYSLPDGVHPSVMAHKEIAKRFYIDVPELFEE